MKEKHKNIEFFIYTASSDSWAHFLIPHIVNVLFGNQKVINKHYFTRSHCNDDGSKSINNVKPYIQKSLKSKYPKSTFDHIYLVDNNIVLKTPEIDRLLYCPSYDYTTITCPMRNFKAEHIEKYYNEISLELLGTHTIHHIHMLKLYYDNAFKEYVHIEKNNEKCKNDNYWQQFEQVVNNCNFETSANILESIRKHRKLHIPQNFQRLFKTHMHFITNFK
jgi:hypothetical protein